MASYDYAQLFDRIKTKADYDRENEIFQLKRAQALQAATGQDPASVKLANEIARARASGDTQRLNDLVMSAKLMDRGVLVDPNGNPYAMGGYGDAVGSIEGAKAGYTQNAKNNSDLNYRPLIARDVAQQEANVKLGTAGGIAQAEKEGSDTGALNVKRQENYSKANAALQGFKQKAQFVNDTIDKANGLISGWSTGYGSYLSGLPNTDARGLKNYLDTIKANVGFDYLQQMREASPTGGALGQVSDMENRLLQAVNGALDPAQSDQLKENLAVIKDLYPKVADIKEQQFNQDYGQVSPQSSVNIGEQNIPMLTVQDLNVDPMAASRNAIMERNAQGIENPYQTLPQPQGQPEAPKRGQVVNGYIFMGGDPSKQSNWKKK